MRVLRSIASRKQVDEGEEPVKRRRLLFGDRIDPKLLVPLAPALAGTGTGVHQAVAGSGPVDGATREVLQATSPDRMTLEEALGSRGLTLRAFSSSIEETLPASEIRKAERLLLRLGYANHDIGIAEFQVAVGIEAIGAFNEQTLRKLESTAERVRAHKPPYLTQGMKSERVKRLQQRLKRLGDFQGVPNGIYGESTVAAVESFRARHHLGESRSWTKGAQKRLMKELGNIAHD